MSFSTLYKFAIGDDKGRERWLLEHFLEHMNFYRTLLGQTPSFKSVLYPIQRMEDPKEWLRVHNRMSQSVWTGAGGGQSIDLETLDWNSPTQVQDWFQLHRDWHYNVRTTLNL